MTQLLAQTLTSIIHSQVLRCVYAEKLHLVLTHRLYLVHTSAGRSQQSPACQSATSLRTTIGDQHG